MVTQFKHKLILENCFHTNYAALKVSGSSMAHIKNNSDLTIGFVRDQNDEDEFYLEIIMKAKNSKTGMKDILRIPVDDIDEIEHLEGTLQFYLHYQTKVSSESSASIGGYFKRKIGSKGKSKSDKEFEKEDKSELFESKFVKQFIETFNNVLEVMDEQEKELNEYMGIDGEEDENKLPGSPNKKQKPKVTTKEEKP